MANIPVLKQIIGLIVWLLIVFGAAAIGGAGSASAGSFYQQLTLPSWSPPSWLFGPVWTVLYAMMGIAVWMVWRVDGFLAHKGALFLFLIHLVFNALWSWLFFAWQRGGLAFAEILLLWILILVVLILFWRVRPTAGILLIPYLLWVSFAAVLNYTLWQLNPQSL